jgi:hypothetical protein
VHDHAMNKHTCSLVGPAIWGATVGLLGPGLGGRRLAGRRGAVALG